METLTDERIHDVFTTFDEDDSGKLSMRELKNALNLLGIDLTDEELADTYRIDDDPDTLNEEEFTSYVRDRIGDIDFPQRTVECFKEFKDEADPDANTISRGQMKIILTKRGDNPMDDETAEELLNDFDLNGDGQFEIHELVKMMYHVSSTEAKQN